MKKILFTAAALAFAVNVKAISLEECYSLARENYPLVRQYELTEAMSRFSFENAAMGYAPKITLSGQATYIMVLKDSGGLVRLYALVNVENYSIVATGETQAQAMVEYKRLLASNGIVQEEPEPEEEFAESTFTVLSVRDVVIDGNSFVYIEGNDGVIYKGSISDNESLIFIGAGDRLKAEYSDTDIANIRKIESFTFVEAAG